MELLLSKGYMIHGLIWRASMFHAQRIEHQNEPTGVFSPSPCLSPLGRGEEVRGIVGVG